VLEDFEEDYWVEWEPQLCLGVGGNICRFNHDRCDLCFDFDEDDKLIAHSSGRVVGPSAIRELVENCFRWLIGTAGDLLMTILR
jgi:hypothetical protein